MSAQPILAAANILIWTLGLSLAVLVAYLAFLTVAALRAPARTPIRPGDPLREFAFLIPAHNEELLLPYLLNSLSEMDYPATQYKVVVVADNCTDATAEIARAMGAAVYERFDSNHIGKGYALQWLLDCLWQASVPFDAAIVLDADSVVSSSFLRTMNSIFNDGGRVVQAHYSVLEPEKTWAVGLRSAALAAVHYLRPQARMVIGASAGLKGNGMLFHREILRRHRWTASVTEDIEYHMTLILSGERVRFAPDAVVQAEMPDGLRASRTQNARWEQGRLELAARYVPQLARTAWAGIRRKGDASPIVLLDAIMEHIIPPFSMLVALSLLFFLAAALVSSVPAMLLAALLLLAEFTYLLVGLVMSGASRRVYLSLLYAPAFLAWKCWLYMRVLLHIERQGWVRTARLGEGD